MRWNIVAVLTVVCLSLVCLPETVSAQDLNVQGNAYLNTSSGKTGIGTTSPAAQLEIYGNYPLLQLYDKGGATGRNKWQFLTRQVYTDDLTFYNVYNSKSVLYLRGDTGSVGIGTTNPAGQLDVVGAVISSAGGQFSIKDTNGYERGRFYAPSASGNLTLWKSDGSANVNINAGGDSYLQGGNVSIGTSSPQSGYVLTVNGSIYHSGSCQGSSKDYKKDILHVNTTKQHEMLDRLSALEPATFRYKEQFGGDGLHLGFIAEEMPSEVLSKDGKAIDTMALMAYTVGALKAEIEQTKVLKAKVAAMEAEIKALKENARPDK